VITLGTNPKDVLSKVTDGPWTRLASEIHCRVLLGYLIISVDRTAVILHVPWASFDKLNTHLLGIYSAENL